MSDLEELFVFQLIASDAIPSPVREHRWAAHQVKLGPGIKQRLSEAGFKDWRFDFAWPDYKLAVEVEGGGWSGGGHTRGKGFAADMRKYFCAMMNGWTVLRVDGGMVKSGEALNGVEHLFLKRRRL